jgi:integrase
MASLRDRFEAKVDRTSTHHLWMGARLPDGSGQLKVDGRVTTARRVAWELAHGVLKPDDRVIGCPDEAACVRVEHLSLQSENNARSAPSTRRRGVRGSGTKVEVRPGVWKLTVTAGRFEDGRVRREHRTVHAKGEDRANRALAEFAAEVRRAPLPRTQVERDMCVDDAIALFLTHLSEDKGREAGTLRDYRSVHTKWFSPVIGKHRVRDVDEEDIDRIFGAMRRAGLSASRMNAARNLYGPFFRWARRRRMIQRSPMAEFEMPTSMYVAHEHTPPEVDQLCLYLATAVEVIPDVAPVLTLGAVTGMRRGELVAVRRSRLFPEKGYLKVDAAVDDSGLKITKTRLEREVVVDEATMAMLMDHCEVMDERAASFGTEVGPDGFVFSRQPDCSEPMSAQYVTRQVAVLKDYLGIATKQPETIAREDEALRLFRQQPAPRPPGKPGQAPKGGLSYEEIGRRLGRSTQWARLAVDSALRREGAAAHGPTEFFDGSILALRKFTSSELLDAGFNIAAVAQRQGHAPEVLARHYAKARRSADRKAAAHLGRIVHQGAPFEENAAT